MVDRIPLIQKNTNQAPKPQQAQKNVDPDQVWTLLTGSQQRRVMQVLIQVGRHLAQNDRKEGTHDQL